MIQNIADKELELTKEVTRLTAELEAEKLQAMESVLGVVEQRDALKDDIENLHTVMMAAAVEITEHWDAHCDAEGYGPVNLVRRLENGFPSRYGYDSQTLIRAETERDALRAELAAEKLFSKQAMASVLGIAAQRDAARAELYEGKHCQCGYDDVCEFAREAEKLKAELEALQNQKPVATVQTIHGVTIGYLEKRMQDGTKLYLSAGAKEKTE